MLVIAPWDTGGRDVEDKLNFKDIAALIVDGDRFSSTLIGQILRGFGLNHHVTAVTGEEAKKQLSTNTYDLLITEAVQPVMKGADLIKWLRRHSSDRVRYISVVVLTGYAHYSGVTAVRVSGVNSVVRKPVAPSVLFDHIAWSANTDRPFIDADEYSGPCRRFHFGDAAPGLNRRVGDRYPGADGSAKTQDTERTTD